MGVDMDHFVIPDYNGFSVHVVLWDTCGQEIFRSLAKSYYKKAHGAVLVYFTF